MLFDYHDVRNDVSAPLTSLRVSVALTILSCDAIGMLHEALYLVIIFIF